MRRQVPERPPRFGGGHDDLVASRPGAPPVALPPLLSVVRGCLATSAERVARCSLMCPSLRFAQPEAPVAAPRREGEAVPNKPAARPRDQLAAGTKGAGWGIMRGASGHQGDYARSMPQRLALGFAAGSFSLYWATRGVVKVRAGAQSTLYYLCGDEATIPKLLENHDWRFLLRVTVLCMHRVIVVILYSTSTQAAM